MPRVVREGQHNALRTELVVGPAARCARSAASRLSRAPCWAGLAKKRRRSARHPEARPGLAAQPQDLGRVNVHRRDDCMAPAIVHLAEEARHADHPRFVAMRR